MKLKVMSDNAKICKYILDQKYLLRDFIAPYPYLFNPLYYIFAPKTHKNLLVNKNTDLVIEGFPRSANTFAVVAFVKSQKKFFSIAHHLHAESQILEGVRKEIPVIVLIREPSAAIRSLAVRHPLININYALNRYLKFYSIVNKVKDKVLIADFKDVITNYGNIIERINYKFNTDYGLFDHTEKNVERVYSEIESINNAKNSGMETHNAKPSNQRNKLYKQITLELNYSKLKCALSLYNSLIVQ